MCSPIDGSREDAAESLQKQIDFDIGEANRLRYAQNLHTTVSRLPTELLAEAFFCIVESGLRDRDSCFAAGTFNFLQVCKHWNEVALGDPRLWRWWVVGAVRAWPLFSSLSKGSPLYLVWWSQLPPFARGILMDPKIPERVRRLDFSGTIEQLESFISAFNLSPLSKVSSIRLRIHLRGDFEPRDHLARFLSSSFPELSHLALENFLPNSSPPIFTAPNLISLELTLHSESKNHYTFPQFLQILRSYPSIRELVLVRGGIPRSSSSGTSPTSFTFPQLVDLRLCGTEEDILGFVDAIDMSSLHNVALCFKWFWIVTAPAPALARAVEKALVACRECRGLKDPRKVNSLTVSYNPENRHLDFYTQSCRSTPTSNLNPSLLLRFDGVGAASDEMIREVLPLFPLDDIREFCVGGLRLRAGACRGMLQKMKNVSWLELRNIALRPALEALSSEEGMFKVIAKPR